MRLAARTEAPWKLASELLDSQWLWLAQHSSEHQGDKFFHALKFRCVKRLSTTQPIKNRPDERGIGFFVLEGGNRRQLGFESRVNLIDGADELRHRCLPFFHIPAPVVVEVDQAGRGQRSYLLPGGGKCEREAVIPPHPADLPVFRPLDFLQ